MKLANKIVQLLIIVLNAAFIGAMIFIALVLIPFWKASEPLAFLDWFATRVGLTRGFMLPFGPATLGLAIAAFVLSDDTGVDKTGG